MREEKLVTPNYCQSNLDKLTVRRISAVKIVMQDPIVRHSFVLLNGSFVHLVQYGFGESLIRSRAANLNDNYSFNSSTAAKSGSKSSSYKHETKGPRKLILFMPGNPGILGVYHDFLMAFYRMISSPSGRSLDSQPTILAMGHNNFDHPDHVQYRAEERICIEETDLNFVERGLAKNYYNEPHHVELQVLNKLIILKKLLKDNLEDCKLVFIGHSIGCYLILRLLQDRSIAGAHEGSVLIHPALENIGDTEKGLACRRLFSYKVDLVMRSLAMVVDKLLPKSVQLALTKWLCSQDFVLSSSEMVLESVAQLACPKTITALVQMAKSEFATVRDINTDSMIRPHVSKLKLIYALNDHWVNSDNRRMLKELYPDLYIEEQATSHAFVMNPQTVIDYAFKVGVFVQDFIDNIDQM